MVYGDDTVLWLNADVVEMATCTMTGVDMIGVVKDTRTQEFRNQSYSCATSSFVALSCRDDTKHGHFSRGNGQVHMRQ